MRFQNDASARRRLGQRVVVRMKLLNGDESAPLRGTVIAIDKPGQPPGVEVRLDQPVNGLSVCYATHREVRAT